jgi:hypothetical protein
VGRFDRLINLRKRLTFLPSRAKLLLRKKKFQEGLLERTDGQLDNLERLVHDLEFAQVEKQVQSTNPLFFSFPPFLIFAPLGPGGSEDRQRSVEEGQ